VPLNPYRDVVSARGSLHHVSISSSSDPAAQAAVSSVITTSTVSRRRRAPPPAAAVPASFAGSRPQLTVHRHTGQEPRRSSHGSMQGAWNTCPHAYAAVTSPRKGSRHTGQSPAGPEELVSAPRTAGDDSVLATAGAGRAVATRLDSRPGTRSRSPMRARKRRRVSEMVRRRAT
jgi:hypothetical protein